MESHTQIEHPNFLLSSTKSLVVPLDHVSDDMIQRRAAAGQGFRKDLTELAVELLVVGLGYV